MLEESSSFFYQLYLPVFSLQNAKYRYFTIQELNFTNLLLFNTYGNSKKSLDSSSISPKLGSFQSCPKFYMCEFTRFCALKCKIYIFHST